MDSAVITLRDKPDVQKHQNRLLISLVDHITCYVTTHIGIHYRVEDRALDYKLGML